MAKQTGRPRALANVSDKVILTALANARGVWGRAAMFLRTEGIRVSRQTLAAHVNARPDLRERLDEIVATRLDLAETVVQDAVESGDVQSARWVLSTIGRERGYGKPVEVKVTTPPPQQSTIDPTQYTQDELRLLHVMLARGLGKKSLLEDEMVARGLVPARAASSDPEPASP